MCRADLNSPVQCSHRVRIVRAYYGLNGKSIFTFIIYLSTAADNPCGDLLPAGRRQLRRHLPPRQQGLLQEQGNGQEGFSMCKPLLSPSPPKKSIREFFSLLPIVSLPVS